MDRLFHKPVFWMVIAVALAAVAVGVCLLANPVAAGISEELPSYSMLHAGANGEILSSASPSSAEVNHALAETQARRLAAHLAEFSEPPRGENGFGSEFSGDWDGDGKPDKAYMHADGQLVTIEFGDGMTLTADALILEEMSGWGRRFLIESADLTGDGLSEILLFIDLGGNGGHGHYVLYPYRRNERGWTLMDAPHHGYELALTWNDNIATVASGNYSEIIGDEAMIRAHYFTSDSQESAQIIWNEINGAAYYSGNAADAPCDIALTTQNGKTLVKILQYTIGMTGAHADKLGYLVTTLEWDESGACTARHMHFILYPQ